MPPVVKVLGAIVLAMIVGAFLVDRVLLWCESRGWVYWRRTKPNTRSAGNAFLELQSLVEPRSRYVLEAKRQEEDAADSQDSSGDDPPVR